MPVINTHQAKTQLSRLLNDVSKGHEFIIGRAGKPIAKLVPFKATHTKRKGGQLRGKIDIAKDFDSLPNEFMKYFS